MYHISKSTVKGWIENLRITRSQVDAMIAELEKAIGTPEPYQPMEPTDLEISCYLEMQAMEENKQSPKTE